MKRLKKDGKTLAKLSFTRDSRVSDNESGLYKASLYVRYGTQGRDMLGTVPIGKNGQLGSIKFEQLEIKNADNPYIELVVEDNAYNDSHWVCYEPNKKFIKE